MVTKVPLEVGASGSRIVSAPSLKFLFNSVSTTWITKPSPTAIGRPCIKTTRAIQPARGCEGVLALREGRIRKASNGSLPSIAENTHNRLLVPKLSEGMMELMDLETVMPRIHSVLTDVSVKKKQNVCIAFGRVQLVHCTINLLVSWLFSSADSSVQEALFNCDQMKTWLKNLLLEDPDPSVRREICTGLYKLCLGATPSGAQNGTTCISLLLNVLLEFLDKALVMKPVGRNNPSDLPLESEGKEPFGPACRDYFWIVCRLVDNLPSNKVNKSSVNLDKLARQAACGVVERKIYEMRRSGNNSCDGNVPDDTLVGTLNLLVSVVKNENCSEFKNSPEGQSFLLHLLECLFSLPNSYGNKNLPKCKSIHSRTACYDLIVEMAKGSYQNYRLLHSKLMLQHTVDSHKPYPWEYWPKDDCRSECGYVGLTNLGATCYLATCMQQLYMIPLARQCILGASSADEKEGQSNNNKHLLTLQELQKMFAYLLDSERKAYNPLSFCKTYTMDSLPLNTAEQKDMAEFFIDLLSKMEEMSPDIKEVVKDLFCGTLSNNVVSLDCNHVSKNLEEFYTVRCQVSEMRSLYQSLGEVTVIDMLEGDNMYTCSQCNKKVRAEKRACFKKLPKILAFNTMRYTFNMLTMLKEKVNTHFSFPMFLDMSSYMEHNLIPNDKQEMDGSKE